MCVGDVASPQRDPAFDWYAGGWLGARVDALDLLLARADENTRIVPAYGPVMTRAQLQAERDMMLKLKLEDRVSLVKFDQPNRLEVEVAVVLDAPPLDHVLAAVVVEVEGDTLAEVVAYLPLGVADVAVDLGP